MVNKRVLVLNHFAAPRGAPGGTRHVELFDRLEGWDHLIIASNLNPQTGKTVEDGTGFVTVPVVAYSRNGAFRVLNWISYAMTASFKGLSVGPVDVVYGSSPHLLAGLAAWHLSIMKRAKFVLEVRDLWPRVLVDMGHLRKKSVIYKTLTAVETFLYTRADAIIVMAEGSRTDLVARNVDPGKIHYIPNGADPEDFTPNSSRNQLRKRYGFTRTTAVYAGAHGPANGLDLLLDAAAAVSEIDIVLVGGGVLKDRLRNDAKRRRLANVRFLDPIPKSEIPDLLAAADIGLHVLADVEIFHTAVSPNKVFDYMAAGLITLTNCPGIVSELVKSSCSGVAVGPLELSKGLQELGRMEYDERARIGKQGTTWISKYQSRTAMARRLHDVLSLLCRPVRH